MIHQYKIIGLDVDEVLADLHGPWTEWIRETLAPDFPGFLSWDEAEKRGIEGWRDFVSPEAYLEGAIEPFPEAYPAVQRLREAGAEIAFVTHCINSTAKAKLEWLKGFGLYEPGDAFLPGDDKSVHEIDLLVDDGPKYVLASPCPAIMVTRLHNEDVPWGWRAEDVAHAVDQIINGDKYAYTY